MYTTPLKVMATFELDLREIQMSDITKRSIEIESDEEIVKKKKTVDQNDGAFVACSANSGL